MLGLDFLTQIDTNRFGLQRPNPQEHERILPIEERSTYRDALNRSLKENRSLEETDRPLRVEPPEHTPPSRLEPNSAAENSHDEETENRAEIPQSVLERLETNVAQIVPSLDDFPKAPPGLADSINPVIQILFEVGTEQVQDGTNLDLQIDTEEFSVVPQGLLEAIGQFGGDENRQNSTEISDLLVDDLQGLETLIQNEISIELPLQELVNNAVDTLKPEANSIPETSEESELVAQVTVLETAEGFAQIQTLVSPENSPSESEQNIESLVEELPVEETDKIAVTVDSQSETDSSTNQDNSSEDEAFNLSEFPQTESDDAHTDANRTTTLFAQTSQRTSTNEVDTSATVSEEHPVNQSQNESPWFANLTSQSSNRSETGQVASQVSRDGPLPSPNSHLDTGTSDSNASIQSTNVRQTTPAAMRAAKDQHPTQLIDRVAQAVRVSQQSGRTMKFRLQPPELGTLQVEIQQNNGVLTARLEVQTAAAQKAISENMSQLREAIQQTGANIERIDVQLVETKNEEQPSNQSRERGQEQRQNGEDRSQSRNRDSSESETDSGDENDTGSQLDPGGEQVDIQV